MMKAPDEVKKALVEAIAETFWASNDGDVQDLQVTCDMAHAAMGDALTYIRGLEEKCQRLLRTAEMLNDALKEYQRRDD